MVVTKGQGTVGPDCGKPYTAQDLAVRGAPVPHNGEPLAHRRGALSVQGRMGWAGEAALELTRGATGATCSVPLAPAQLRSPSPSL